MKELNIKQIESVSGGFSATTVGSYGLLGTVVGGAIGVAGTSMSTSTLGGAIFFPVAVGFNLAAGGVIGMGVGLAAGVAVETARSYGVIGESYFS